MKSIGRWLFSNKLTLVALFLFAAAMGYATFLENDFGTPAARGAIYDAWWFEVLMAILCVNFIGNIFRYKLLRKEKRALFTFHIAFLVILIGAFVTRYTSQEGLIRIRENQASNKLITQERFLELQVLHQGKDWGYSKEVNYTHLNQPVLKENLGPEKDPVTFKITSFVPDAVQQMTRGEPYDEVLEIVAASDQGRSNYFLKDGNSVFINGHEITFDNPKPGAINIERKPTYHRITTGETLNYIEMSTQRMGVLEKSVPDTLLVRTLYRSDHLSFVISEIHQGNTLVYETASDKEMAKNAADLLFVNMSTKEEEKEVILASLDGVFSPMQETHIGDYHVRLSYGPSIIELPFDLYLEDFQLVRYPGSTSPSSYASELVVHDADGTSFPVRISMNNVLDHKGYRFFQASYDLDELGTVLSVNQDYWGTRVTYLGYLLMGLGMIFTLFGKESRFQVVSRKLSSLRATVILIALLFAPGLLSGQEGEGLNSEVIPVDRNHAISFGKLMVQDMDGRIKPINTLSSEFLRKISRRSTYALPNGTVLTSDQVFLSIHQDPLRWQYMPLIKVDPEKGAMILKQLKVEDRSMVSFQDMLDDAGDYQLRSVVEAAQRKKPAVRSELDNEIIKVDERFNILFQALSGNFLKIFPQPTDPDQTWFNSGFKGAGFSEEDSLFVRNILNAYYADIGDAQETGNWATAEEKLEYIQTFQSTLGAEIIPEDSRVKAELIYNELNLFNRLFPVFWLLGIVMLVTAIVKVFTTNTWVNRLYSLGVLLTAVAFIVLTGNLILRWYAGGYPPWSNGYEMIILVAWALFLFGFIFFRKSDFILPVVSLFGGTLLFVAFLDWLNPEITNLVPVLKSYWLKIHVAIIVSSYAPLALSALLGILCLIFMIFNKPKLKKPITELTYINELSMTIGLFMLAVGTFLGGVWANESWGRYWGWDPKETWALISIIVYAIVLHLRLIPSLRGEYTFSLASVLAFFSIIMTSFGVNYYLSGLHSYAAGDPLPIPSFVYWVVAAIIVISTAAYLARRKPTLTAKAT